MDLDLLQTLETSILFKEWHLHGSGFRFHLLMLSSGQKAQWLCYHVNTGYKEHWKRQHCLLLLINSLCSRHIQKDFVLVDKSACNYKVARNVFILQLPRRRDYFLCNTQITKSRWKERHGQLTDYLEYSSFHKLLKLLTWTMLSGYKG